MDNFLLFGSAMIVALVIAGIYKLNVDTTTYVYTGPCMFPSDGLWRLILEYVSNSYDNCDIPMHDDIENHVDKFAEWVITNGLLPHEETGSKYFKNAAGIVTGKRIQE